MKTNADIQMNSDMELAVIQNYLEELGDRGSSEPYSGLASACSTVLSQPQGIATDIIAFNCFNATQNFLAFQRLFLLSDVFCCFPPHLLAAWGFITCRESGSRLSETRNLRTSKISNVRANHPPNGQDDAGHQPAPNE
jgi:hypothetical protein